VEEFKHPGMIKGLVVTKDKDGTENGNCITIETICTKGTGKIVSTGGCGQWFSESIEVAMGFIKSHKKELKLKNIDFEKIDLNINIPQSFGNDGPSAGITLTTSIISALNSKTIVGNLAMC
jgi:ATP-dependent Lon protease